MQVRGYARGVSRDRATNRLYMKGYRLRAEARLILASSGDEDGDVEPIKVHRTAEDRVIAELMTIPGAADRPGICAGLISLARVLDDSSQRRVHAPTFAQLRAGLDGLREAGASVPRAGRLSAIRASVTESSDSVAS